MCVAARRLMRLVRRSVLTGADPGCCEGGAEDIISVYHIASACRGVDNLVLGTHAERALGVQRQGKGGMGQGRQGNIRQSSTNSKVRSGWGRKGRGGQNR